MWFTIATGSRNCFETCLNSFQTFICEAHESAGQTFTNRTIANIYLNNQRKISTDAVVADGVRSFKKRQREK